ncbi:unnamed protein product [Discosporangium mesarthrocarpum]
MSDDGSDMGSRSTTTKTSPLRLHEYGARLGSSRFLSQPLFVLYKGALTIELVFWAIYWPYEEGREMWKYFNFWLWDSMAIYFCVSFITAYLYLERGPDDEGKGSCIINVLGWFQLAFWYLCCIISLVVLLLHWVFLDDGEPLDSVDINIHCLAAIFMIIDNLLVAMEYRLEYVWPASLFIIMYTGFNIAWYYITPRKNGNHIIYDQVQWDEEPVRASEIVIGIFFVLVPIFHVFHFIVYRVREGLAGCGSSKSQGNHHMFDTKSIITHR